MFLILVVQGHESRPSARNPSQRAPWELDQGVQQADDDSAQNFENWRA